MPSHPSQAFYAKTWYLYVGLTVFAVMALFCALFGPLFLFGVMRKADGQPGTQAGAIISTIAVPMGLFAFLIWCNIHARRGPMLHIYKEGLEVNLIGAQSLGGVQLAPSIIRVTELLVSGQGIHKQVGWIPWETIRGVDIGGLPMQGLLVIDATVVECRYGDDGQTAKVVEGIIFPEAEFEAPLPTVVAAIHWYHSHLTARSGLPSLFS